MSSSSTEAISQEHERLHALLDYVRKLGELGRRPVLRLDAYRGLVLHAADLRGRVGIRHDVADEDGPAWLVVERLGRTPAPEPPADVREWLAVPNDPDREPAVADTLVRTLDAEEAEGEVAAGRLLADDVLPAEQGDSDALRDVIYRLENLPEVERRIREYIDGAWRAWAERERPRRETMRIYDRLFALRQELAGDGGERPVELVWGTGPARWKTDKGTIDRPLVEQLVEIDLDQHTGRLAVRPRAAEPQIAMEPFLACEVRGADAVLDELRGRLRDPARPELSPFEPETFRDLLEFAAHNLDPRGMLDEQDDGNGATARPAGRELVIGTSWVLFSRPRSEHAFVADVERLQAQLAVHDELPPAARAVVSEPGDEPVGLAGEAGGAGGPGAAGADAGPDELFFPKPFNDEQAQIARLLQRVEGVVVQGPPGTGKTHTIANLVCHYLAMGRRVLVTSKGEPALAVVREHIPEEIRDLTISLLGSEREGLEQLERAVTQLSELAQTARPDELRREIENHERAVAALKRDIQSARDELEQWARKHLTMLKVGPGRKDLPYEVARRAAAGRERRRWFPDRLDPQAAPRFSDADIDALREARRRVAADLRYLGADLPSTADLPDEAHIIALRHELEAHATPEASSNDLPRLSRRAPDALARAERLREVLDSVRAVLRAVDGEHPWLRGPYERWLRGEADGGAGVDALLDGLVDLAHGWRELGGARVTLPPQAAASADFKAAVARAASGKRALGLLAIGKGQVKEWLAAVRVRGIEPRGADDWQEVARYLAWHERAVRFLHEWRSAADAQALPRPPDEVAQAGPWAQGLAAAIEAARTAAFEHRGRVAELLPALFPYGLDAARVMTDAAECRRALEAIEAALTNERAERTRAAVAELRERFARIPAPLGARFLAFFDRLEAGVDAPDAALARQWNELIAELERVRARRADLETIERVTALIEDSGAPRWAGHLRTEPVEEHAAQDRWLPADWRETWEWARVESYLEAIDGRERIRELSQRLLQGEQALQRRYREMVAARTRLGLSRRIRRREAAALAQFAEAMQKMGKGTGIRARRFRRDAREAMDRCYDAVPCWIMPTWRVSETLPSQLASFDLVIFDEASQSDVTALPALLRGRQVLIVGDDRQVSPTAAFIEERRILQLRHHYLQGQPHAALLVPGTSLYSLGKAMFAGQFVMLREHFRCVEPIIRFSCQFYDQPLVPLRTPTAEERLDPPLVDVYVANGARGSGKVNRAEADAIVEEVARLVEDPAFASRTMGVVSLLGHEQARYIQDRLLERIGEERFVAHAIACGDPATFQGKERDIMFISMVDAPDRQQARKTREFQQRYNVAFSRARDREYLYRSITPEGLAPDDLRAKAIRHFQQPMEGAVAARRDLVELCESDFEREVFRRLCDLGYRVKPQVRVGPYRIDLVVEGKGGRRLAVELDGDQYHPPERWAEDFRRQKVLERVGWRFWRCWGSSFALDPDACMQDLLDTLGEMGIEPIGGEAEPEVWVEHRVVGREPDEAAGGAEQAGEATPGEVAAADSPSRAATSRPARDETPAGAPAAQAPEAQAAGSGEALLVQPGDRVQVVFEDKPDRVITVVISETEDDPDNWVIHVSRPLARAVLGRSEDDVFELELDKGTRVGTILAIDRDWSQAA